MPPTCPAIPAMGTPIDPAPIPAHRISLIGAIKPAPWLATPPIAPAAITRVAPPPRVPSIAPPTLAPIGATIEPLNPACIVARASISSCRFS
eukprot:scaffold35953_cov33-Tisochrysis_lutea.AAC.2